MTPLASYLTDLDALFAKCTTSAALARAWQEVDENPLLDGETKAAAWKVFLQHVRRIYGIGAG